MDFIFSTIPLFRWIETLAHIPLETMLALGTPHEKNGINNKQRKPNPTRTIFHWLALGLQGLTLGPQGLALALDTNMLV